MCPFLVCFVLVAILAWWKKGIVCFKRWIKPMMAHYGAMLDILSHPGRLEEAYKFIVDMPIETDAVTWRTLLSASHIYDINNTRVGEKVRRRLLGLEPKRSENLVMVATKYAEIGLWEKAANLRRGMKERRLKKIAGESYQFSE